MGCTMYIVQKKDNCLIQYSNIPTAPPSPSYDPLFASPPHPSSYAIPGIFLIFRLAPLHISIFLSRLCKIPLTWLFLDSGAVSGQFLCVTHYFTVFYLCSLHHYYVTTASFLHHICIILFQWLHHSYTMSASFLYDVCTPLSPCLHRSYAMSACIASLYYIMRAPLSHHGCTAHKP